jgi:hypothetical protein
MIVYLKRVPEDLRWTWAEQIWPTINVVSFDSFTNVKSLSIIDTQQRGPLKAERVPWQSSRGPRDNWWAFRDLEMRSTSFYIPRISNQKEESKSGSLDRF